MIKVKQPRFVAALALAFLVVAVLSDAYSVFAACGRPGVEEMNPRISDPCRALDWNPFQYNLLFMGAFFGLLFWVARSKKPLCLATHLVHFRIFLDRVWLTGPFHYKSFAFVRVTALWSVVYMSFLEAVTAISNFLAVSAGTPGITRSLGVVVEKFLLLIGHPNERFYTYDLGYVILFPLLMLAGQWLTWRLLRWSLRFDARATAPAPPPFVF